MQTAVMNRKSRTKYSRELPSTDTIIGRVDFIRRDKNLTSEAFSNHLGLDNSSYSTMIHGKRKINVPMLLSLAIKFGANMNYVLLGVGPTYMDEMSEYNSVKNCMEDKESYIKTCINLLKMVVPD